jgi:molybdopterin molybdotransferase
VTTAAAQGKPLPGPASGSLPGPLPWNEARAGAYAAGLAARPAPIEVAIAEADGLTLAEPLTPSTDLPAFATSSVDGYAVRGPGPWRLAGRVLAGEVAPQLAAGAGLEIATGAMVPIDTDQIIRVEDSSREPDGRISGRGRPMKDWREPGDEATKGEQLLTTGTIVTPGVIGLAASCGHDVLRVIPPTRAAVVILGDELLTAGPPGQGRVRDALGPQLPAWLRRCGATTVPGFAPRGPVADTLEAHVDAIRAALEVADLVCTTGGTMHGPVDHLHPALRELGATYIANTVAVRPGFPMLLAQVPGVDGRPRFVAGLPGNPQSAIVALVSLVAPLLAGLTGRAAPPLGRVTLAHEIPGRGGFTHLSLVRVEPDGLAYPLEHAGSAMLRGLARSDGFAVVAPGVTAGAAAQIPLVALPLLPGDRP